MQRTGLNPPCHRLTPLPVCRHRRPSRAAPGPVGAPSRLCVSVCVHLCDVYPCACVAEQSCSNDTLCRSSLQAEQAPRVLQVTRGLQLPPTALTGPSELFPGPWLFNGLLYISSFHFDFTSQRNLKRIFTFMKTRKSANSIQHSFCSKC